MSGYMFDQTVKSVPEEWKVSLLNVNPTFFSESAGYPRYDVQIQSPLSSMVNSKKDFTRSFSKKKPITESEIIKGLQSKIRDLEGKVFQLEQHQRNPVTIHCIEIRDLPYVEIKQQVLEYYKSHDDGLYPDEIAVALGFDLESVMKAVHELQSDDELEVIH